MDRVHVFRIEVRHPDTISQLADLRVVEVRVLVKGDPRLLGDALGKASVQGDPEVREFMKNAVDTATAITKTELETEWLNHKQPRVN
jgi:hypothetical protein